MNINRIQITTNRTNAQKPTDSGAGQHSTSQNTALNGVRDSKKSPNQDKSPPRKKTYTKQTHFDLGANLRYINRAIHLAIHQEQEFSSHEDCIAL